MSLLQNITKMALSLKNNKRIHLNRDEALKELKSEKMVTMTILVPLSLKEDVKINFNPKVKVEKTPNKPPIMEAELPKKDTKIKKVFKNWKDQQEEEEKKVDVVKLPSMVEEVFLKVLKKYLVQ